MLEKANEINFPSRGLKRFLREIIRSLKSFKSDATHFLSLHAHYCCCRSLFCGCHCCTFISTSILIQEFVLVFFIQKNLKHHISSQFFTCVNSCSLDSAHSIDADFVFNCLMQSKEIRCY